MSLAAAGRGSPWPAILWAVLLPAASAWGATPEWLLAAAANPPAPRNANVVAIQLLNASEARYLSADRVRRQWRGAMKVVTAAGFGVAPVTMTYNAGTDRIISARAWAVSADGRRVKAFGAGDFVDHVVQYNKYFWDAQRGLTFDGQGRVEVGGVLAWEIQVESPSGVLSSSWSFRSDLDVARGSFEVFPMPGGTLEWHATSPSLRAPLAGAEPGSLRWEQANQNPFITGRPDGFLPNPLEVSVRCVPARPAGQPATTWLDESRIAAGLMGPKIEAGGAVKAQAEALVAGRSSRWERIRALAEFTQRDVVYLEIDLAQDYLSGYRPHAAADVLRNRYGDCKDKATLLLSLLRAVGEGGYAVLLNAGNPSATLEDWPSLNFNHAIVALPADGAAPAAWPVVDAGPLGRLVIFDPTDSTTPLGVLSPSDQGGFGLIVDARQGRLVRLPIADSSANTVARTIKARLGAQGELRATVEESCQGLAAAELHGARFALGTARFKQRLESRVHQATPLAQKLQWSDAWDAAAARYRLNFDFVSERFGRPMGGDMMLLAPRILPEGGALLPWRTAAEGSVWLAGSALDEEVRIALPDGATIAERPEDWSGQEPSVSARLSYRQEGPEIVYHCQLNRRGGFYARAEYEALRLFEARLLQAQRRPVLLRLAGAAAPAP